jgi:hypothetical protein
MSLRQRIARLERKMPTLQEKYAHLTDDQLRAHIVRIATELQASAPLDPETATFLKANGLRLADEPR